MFYRAIQDAYRAIQDADIFTRYYQNNETFQPNIKCHILLGIMGKIKVQQIISAFNAFLDIYNHKRLNYKLL